VRTVLICSFMLLMPFLVYPQEEDKNFREFSNEIQKEFAETILQSRSEYDTFIDSINQEYIKLIQEAEGEFSELLQESFKEFKVMPVDERPEVIKQNQIPGFKATPQEKVSNQLIERNISLENSQDIVLPLATMNRKFTGSTNKVSLQFLGSLFSVDFDSNISQMPDLLKPDAITIKNCYDFLRNTNYPPVLEQLSEISRQMNLNDWDYYCLISEFCKSVTDKPNARKVIAWFLLSESNFKVKIGYFKTDASILIATGQTLYNTPWFNINGERYYALSYEQDSIFTYNIGYFKGIKNLNIFHDKPLMLEAMRKDRTITFPYLGKTYSIPVSYDQSYVDYYASYPMIPVDYYFALPVSSTFKESVEINISPYLQNRNRLESLHFLLNLVQYGFNYKTDIEQFKHEKYMVPEEILYYNNSDCDDRTILFSYLVRELLHLDVVALDFDGHICSAVEVSDPSLKGNLTYNGKEYIVCDATYAGAPPGIILPPFQVKNAVIVDFNKKLYQYRLFKNIWSSVNNKGLMPAENTQNIIASRDGSIFLTGMMIKDSLSSVNRESDTGGKSRAFIARLNSSKEIQWIKQLQGSGTNSGYCISQVDDQFLYVFGYFRDTLKLDNYTITAQEHGSFYLAKLNESGESYWLKKIYLPTDSLSQGITTVIDSNGDLKYYMLNDNYPHENNYMIQADDKGYCYIYAILPQKDSGSETSKHYASGQKFDIVTYLINGNDNLLKQNYPKSVSMLYTIFQFLNNTGSVIQGPSLQQTIATVYKNLISVLPGQYSEVGKISEIINTDGITSIRTIDRQPININPLQAQHESRVKLSCINGNAKIDVLNGIKIGSNKIWNDVNYILLDKTTGQIFYNYDNQYRKKMPVHSQIL
jgi:hypothetical protein